MGPIFLAIGGMCALGLGIYILNLARPWLSASPAERAAKSQVVRREYAKNLAAGGFLSISGLRMLAQSGAKLFPAYSAELEIVQIALVIGIIICSVALFRAWRKES